MYRAQSGNQHKKTYFFTCTGVSCVFKAIHYLLPIVSTHIMKEIVGSGKLRRKKLIVLVEEISVGQILMRLNLSKKKYIYSFEPWHVSTKWGYFCKHVRNLSTLTIPLEKTTVTVSVPKNGEIFALLDFALLVALSPNRFTGNVFTKYGTPTLLTPTSKSEILISMRPSGADLLLS